MKFGLSSSSPLAVAALLDDGFSLVEERTALAQRNASGLLIEMMDSILKSHAISLDDVTGIVVDRGPGGFTGVKVAVTLAKVFSWSRQVRLFSVTSFDLIDFERTVSVPFKQGTYIVRHPNEEPLVTDTFEGVGYGGNGEQHFPTFASLRPPVPVEPDKLVPFYVAPPSISSPKGAFGQAPIID